MGLMHGPSSGPEPQRRRSPRKFSPGTIDPLAATRQALAQWERNEGLHEAVQATGPTGGDREVEQLFSLAVCELLMTRFELSPEAAGPIFRWLQGYDHSADTVARATAAHSRLINVWPSVDSIFTPGPEPDALRIALPRAALSAVMEDAIRVLAVRPALFALQLALGGHRVDLCVTADGGSRITLEPMLADLIARRGVDEHGFLLLPLNPVASKVLGHFGVCAPARPTQTLPRPSSDQKTLPPVSQPVLTESEQAVIALLRGHETQRLTVHVRSGVAIRADVGVEIPLTSLAPRKLDELVADCAFQRVEITTKDGKVAHVAQTKTHMLAPGTGRTGPGSDHEDENNAATGRT